MVLECVDPGNAPNLAVAKQESNRTSDKFMQFGV